MSPSILQDAMFLTSVVFEVRGLDPPPGGGRHWVETQGFTDAILRMKRVGYTPDRVAEVLVAAYRKAVSYGGDNDVGSGDRQAR
jgi:hypothetical protein